MPQSRLSTTKSTLLIIAACTTSILLAGCDHRSAGTITEALLAPAMQVPELPPASDFVEAVTNPFFPLTPGTVLSYRSETADGVETTVDSVTDRTRTILGIAATVVHDQVYLDGVLIEDTFDWYAQDRWGNVWYLGEQSCEIANAECVSDDGSWEAGVDGAEAGIIMWADPGAHKGENYRQEFYAGVAEDMGKVLRMNVMVELDAFTFHGCLQTMDWTPLEPGAREHKIYCPGTGLVLELSPADGRARNELISVAGAI